MNKTFPAIAVALAASVIGAALWAAVVYVTEYELGYVAWAIGGLVGFATVLAGGRGPAVAATASILTLGGIFCGKVAGANWVAHKAIRDQVEADLTPALYEELKQDAALFAQLGSSPENDALSAFLGERGYTEGPDATPAEIAAFNQHDRARLEALTQSTPAFSTWREQVVAAALASFDAEVALIDAVYEELNVVDVVFALLAVSTAFGIVSRAQGTETMPEPIPIEERARRAA